MWQSRAELRLRRPGRVAGARRRSCTSSWAASTSRQTGGRGAPGAGGGAETTRPDRPRPSPAPSGRPHRSSRRSTSSSAAARSPTSRPSSRRSSSWSASASCSAAGACCTPPPARSTAPATRTCTSGCRSRTCTMAVAFAARRGARLEHLAPPPVVAAHHRRLGRRARRAARHRPGRLPVAHREPQPAHEGARVHRQQPRPPRKAAYQLNDITQEPLSPKTPLTPQKLEANQPTLRNIRLWDPNTLVTSYRQLQELRPYYVVPRRRRGPLHRQRRLPRDDALAARAQHRRPAGAGADLGQPAHHLHARLRRGDVGGQPGDQRRLARLPRAGRAAAERHGPRDHAAAHLLRRARHRLQPREDQGQGVRLPRPPTATCTATTRAAGASPSRRSSTASPSRRSSAPSSSSPPRPSRIRAASSSGTRSSTRISAAAPFLTLDHDPYMVIADGRLWWVQDAYTTTGAVPVLHPAGRRELPAQLGQDRRRRLQRHHEVLRVRPTDPLLKTYEAAYPSLFTPKDEMPQALLDHLRYPEDLFNVQAETLLHVPRRRRRRPLQQGRPVGDPRQRVAVRRRAHGRLLRDHEAAGRRQGGVPAHAAVRAERPPEHDLLARRPLRHARLRQGAQLRLLHELHGVRAQPGRGDHQPGPRRSARSARSGGSRAPR